MGMQGLQGNLSSQRPVTIFDPIHDSVRAALASRYAVKNVDFLKNAHFVLSLGPQSIRPQKNALFS